MLFLRGERKVYAYDRREQRTRMEPHLAIDKPQRNQYGKWKGKIRSNRSFTNVTTKNMGRHHHRDHRTRSKTTDSMELWEWNGMNWVMRMTQSNESVRNKVQVKIQLLYKSRIYMGNKSFHSSY